MLHDEVQGAPSSPYTVAHKPGIVGENTGMKGWRLIWKGLQEVIPVAKESVDKMGKELSTKVI